MKKILIVGEHGFVATSFGYYMKKFNSYELTFISSRNDAWKQHDFHGYNCVFNASGLAHANAMDGSDEDYIEVNGKLPGQIARKAKEEGVPLYISISSEIIYGDTSELGESKVIKKDTVPTPDGIYGKSKIMGEKEVLQYADDTFQTAILRPPMIYSEDAVENFARLCSFAVKSPIFPKLKNEQSMIYIDNLCELIRLIIDNNEGGIYFPQEREYMQTSKLVKDISKAAGNNVRETKVFNGALKLLSHRFRFIRKAFGNLVYDKSLSGHFGWKYCVVDYEESIRRIAEQYKK